MKRLGVVLFSGGLDSTTAAALARRGGYGLLAVTGPYAQVHRRKIDPARRAAGALGMRHHILDVSFFRDLPWY